MRGRGIIARNIIYFIKLWCVDRSLIIVLLIFSVKPITESTTVADYPTTKTSTIASFLSTIASVTIDTELPVPMETLNMSDYKQG